MMIRKVDDYFLIKVYQEEMGDFDVFDQEKIKNFFQNLFERIGKKYQLKGLVDVDVYVNFDYGMIIEIHPVCDYFAEVDMNIHIHLGSIFLVEIDMNDILDYEDVYYYKGKFYGNYLGICDNEVFYKNTKDIIQHGIKVC